MLVVGSFNHVNHKEEAPAVSGWVAIEPTWA